MYSNNNLIRLDEIVGTPSKLILVYASKTDYKPVPFCKHLVFPRIRFTDFILGITYDETSKQLRHLNVSNRTETQRQIEDTVTEGRGYEGRLPHLHDYLFEDGLKEYLGCLDVIDEMTQIDGAPQSRLFESPLKQLLERNHVQIIERDSNGTSIMNIPAGDPVEVLSYKDLPKKTLVIHDLHLGAAQYKK